MCASSFRLVGAYSSKDALGNGEIQFSPDGKWLTVYNGLEQQGWFDARESEIVSLKIGGDFLPAGKRTTDNNGDIVSSNEIVKQVVENGNVNKGSLDFGAKGQHLFYNQYTLALIPNSSTQAVNAFSYHKLLTVNGSPYVIQEEGRMHDLRRSQEYSVNNSTFSMLSTGDNASPSFYSWNHMAYYENLTANSTSLGLSSERSAGFLPTQPHIVHVMGTVPTEPQYRSVADKNYELTDHLGNVRVTVSDRKNSSGQLTWPVNSTYSNNLIADIQSVNNYYAGGMLMPGRSFSSSAYRFGFNGKEKDDEVKGSGNQYDYGFRIYDPRIVRFLSVDPIAKSYPMLTPYQFAANMPIWAQDLDGLEALITNHNDKTITFVANVYFVTKGIGNVASSDLSKSSDDLIVNQLSESARTINGYKFQFQLNYISTDENGNPLTFEKAQELAKNSKITYDDGKGNVLEISGEETAVITVGDEATSYSLNDQEKGRLIPMQINEDGNFNMIILNKTTSMTDHESVNKSYSHELGHYLGRRGLGGSNLDPQKNDHAGGLEGTDPGITSREDKNIRLVPQDLPKMYGGAKLYGKSEEIPKR